MATATANEEIEAVPAEGEAKGRGKSKLMIIVGGVVAFSSSPAPDSISPACSTALWARA